MIAKSAVIIDNQFSTYGDHNHCGCRVIYNDEKTDCTMGGNLSRMRGLAKEGTVLRYLVRGRLEFVRGWVFFDPPRLSRGKRI